MAFQVRANGIEYRFIPRGLARKGAKDTVKTGFYFVSIRLTETTHHGMYAASISLEYDKRALTLVERKSQTSARMLRRGRFLSDRVIIVIVEIELYRARLRHGIVDDV